MEHIITLASTQLRNPVYESNASSVELHEFSRSLLNEIIHKLNILQAKAVTAIQKNSKRVATNFEDEQPAKKLCLDDTDEKLQTNAESHKTINLIHTNKKSKKNTRESHSSNHTQEISDGNPTNLLNDEQTQKNSDLLNHIKKLRKIAINHKYKVIMASHNKQPVFFFKCALNHRFPATLKDSSCPLCVKHAKLFEQIYIDASYTPEQKKLLQQRLIDEAKACYLQENQHKSVFSMHELPNNPKTILKLYEQLPPNPNLCNLLFVPVELRLKGLEAIKHLLKSRYKQIVKLIHPDKCSIEDSKKYFLLLDAKYKEFMMKSN